MFKIKQVNCEFAPIWRVFISGSSSAGKTYFARQLLQAKLFDFERIYYYHPDIQEDFPTDWQQFFSKPVFYQAGLPSIQDLLEIPTNSCVILDDLFREASSSKDIDYLFRVLSGKRKLHVIIMTQRYFSDGAFALSIRNSSNYHVLMNNADSRINMRAANTLGLKNDFILAQKANKSKLYPYVFIDQTNKARVNGLQIYIDILSKHKEVIYNSMLGYWISNSDFKSNFHLIDKNTAQHADKTETQKHESTSREASSKNAEINENIHKNKRGNKPLQRYLERRRIERTVKQALHKHSGGTKL